jgi:hypothetical protein
MALIRAFISFDYDHDEDLRTMLVGQSKHPDTPFEIADWSVKKHLSGDWKEQVRARVRRVDQMAVLCGVHTDIATGVATEVAIARTEGKPYFLLKGRKGYTCPRPTVLPQSERDGPIAVLDTARRPYHEQAYPPTPQS